MLFFLNVIQINDNSDTKEHCLPRFCKHGKIEVLRDATKQKTSKYSVSDESAVACRYVTS